MLNAKNIRTEFGRLMRFGIVGVVASLTYAGVTYVIVDSGIGKPTVATIVGQLSSALISYFGHQRFSFAVASTHKIFVWRFISIFVLTFAMNIGVTFLLTERFGVSYRVTIAIVTVLIPLTNYFCNRFWVFRPGLVQSTKVDRA